MADPTDKNLDNSCFNELRSVDARFFDLIEERINRDIIAYCVLDSIRSVRDMLHQIGWRICGSEFQQAEEIESNLEEIFEKLVLEMGSICKIGKLIESIFSYYDETRKKEKRELENSILSLTEENRDIRRLLKVAVMEKEAMERKSRNTTGENRRGSIMQIAEKGLQKVGFGFVMGVLSGDSQPDPFESSSASRKSDASDAEEDISLTETMESIMKNLRNEINDLRRDLQESRSSNEQLQAFVDEQAQKLKENEMHIKDLEERETLMSSSVEELKKEMTVAGEEITRWREACELEVEAGKAVIKERDKALALLKDELEQTKKSLEASNNKLQLKERLAATAMAAQAAAETCLRLADSRSAGLRDKIEELTKQLEEEEDEKTQRGRGTCRRVRHMCWPWYGFRIPHAAARVASWRLVRNRRSMPEMEALLRLKI